MNLGWEDKMNLKQYFVIALTGASLFFIGCKSYTEQEREIRSLEKQVHEFEMRKARLKLNECSIKLEYIVDENKDNLLTNEEKTRTFLKIYKLRHGDYDGKVDLSKPIKLNYGDWHTGLGINDYDHETELNIPCSAIDTYFERFIKQESKN